MSGQDNMCGGANPLKSFRDQVGRDRSLHQDRVVNNGTSSTTFRSAPPQVAANGDQEFANFQAGMANIPNMPAHRTGPIQGQSSAFLAPVQHPMAPAPAPISAVNPNWFEEFRQFQTKTEPAPAVANVGHGPSPAPGLVSGFVPAPAMGIHTASPFMPTNMYQPHMAMAPAQFNQAQSAVTPAPAAPTTADTEHPLVTDAFTAMFAQVEADHEAITEQKARERLNDVNDVEAAVDHLQRHQDSFEQEMSSWMHEHGPTPEEVMTAIADDQDKEEMEALAEDMGKVQMDDLRRTAQEIVTRLGDTPRYQQSAFLTLMRNIMDGNVTVDEAQEGFVTTNDHQPYTGHLEDAAGNSTNQEQEKNN